MAALASLGDRLQAILVAPPELVDSPPDHVLVRASVPQLDLLPALDVVVCHAGHNTVCEALSHGLPLVVAGAGPRCCSRRGRQRSRPTWRPRLMAVKN